MHRRSDRGRLAVDLCLVFDLGDHADSGQPPAARTSKASGPLKADPATTATAIAMLYAQPTKLPPGSAAKGGFADRSKAVFTLTTCARTNKQPADFYL